MWSYICYIQVFLVLTHAIQERNSEERRIYNRDESIFSDVIRNISRVNNVLQELITNYEHLQKIYKSEENMEKDYSTDEEIDEVFKTTNSDRNKRGRYINKSRDKSKELNIFPATKIIWSDDDGTDDDSVEEPKENNAHKSKSNKSEMESIATEIKSTPVKKAEVILENTSDEFKEIKEYEIDETPKKDKVSFTDISTKNNTKIKDELQFASINKRPKMKFTKKTSKKLTTKKISKIIKKPQYYNDSKSDNVSSESKITKKIKRIVYSEAFSPKTIWNEIIQNKPIHLKAQEEMYATKKRKDREIFEPHLRSVDGETALVRFSKHENLEKQESSQSIDEEAKDMLKTNILRHAYGDACLKVVVRKCYEACKHASRTACIRNSCNRKIKHKFRESAKKGCLNEFRPAFNNNATKQNNMRATSDFSDATRSGLLAACHANEEQKPKLRVLKNEKKFVSPNLGATSNKKLDILRDRYERACRRASAKKCVTVCNYASKTTCDTYACSKRLKTAYRTFCRKHCSIAYEVGHWKSSSESDATSSADSSSDTSVTHI